MEGNALGQTTTTDDPDKLGGRKEGCSPTPVVQANTTAATETVLARDGDAFRPEDTAVRKVPMETHSFASSLESVKSSTGTLSTPAESAYSMNAADYSLGPAIGFGSSAIVYYATYLPTGTPVAIKMIELDHFERNQIDELRREIQVMTLCRHPNLLRVLSSFVYQAKLWIVTPYLSGGSCLDIMKTGFRDGFEESVIATILTQALRGLDYLHKNGHIHRDFKAGNLLMDEGGGVQLADFGVSSCLSEDVDRRGVRKTFVGTPCWMAPEVMEMSGRGYDCKADIWSFGITALELAYGQAPFSRYPPMKVIYMTLSGAPPTLDRQRAKHRYSRTFKEMIDVCLHKDPNKRPTADLLLKHPFFKAARKKSFLVDEVLTRVPPLQDRPRVKRLVKQVNRAMTSEERERVTALANNDEDVNDTEKYANGAEDAISPSQWEFSSDYGIKSLSEEEPTIPDTALGHAVDRSNCLAKADPDNPEAAISSSTGGTLTRCSRFVVELNGGKDNEDDGGIDKEDSDDKEPMRTLLPENRVDDGRSTTATSVTSTIPKDPMANDEDEEEATIRKGRFSVLESATPTGSTDTPSSSSSSSAQVAAPVSSLNAPSQLPLLPALPEEYEEGRRSRFQVETTATITTVSNESAALIGSPLATQAAALPPQSSATATLTSSRFEVSTSAAATTVVEPQIATANTTAASMAHPMAHLFANTGKSYIPHYHQQHPSAYSDHPSQFEYSSPPVARSSPPLPLAMPRNDRPSIYQYQHRPYGGGHYASQQQQPPVPQLAGAIQIHPSQIDQLLLLNELIRQQLLEIRHSPSPLSNLPWGSHPQSHPDVGHLGSNQPTVRDFPREWQRGIPIMSPPAPASTLPFYSSRVSMYGTADMDPDFGDEQEDPIILPPLPPHYTVQGVPTGAYSPHPSMGAMAANAIASSLSHGHKRRSFSIDHRYRPPMAPGANSTSNNQANPSATSQLPSHAHLIAPQLQNTPMPQDCRLPHQQHRLAQSLKSPIYHHFNTGIGHPNLGGNEPPPQFTHHSHSRTHYPHHHQPTPMPLASNEEAAPDRHYQDQGGTPLDPVESLRKQLEALQRENQHLRRQQPPSQEAMYK